MMVIDVKYEIGDVVYLKTDPDQNARIVFGYTIFKQSILYRLGFGTTNSEHYDFEISETKDVINAI